MITRTKKINMSPRLGWYPIQRGVSVNSTEQSPKKEVGPDIRMLGLHRIAFDAGKFEQLQIFDHFVRGKKTGVPQESFSLSELLTCTESGFFSFRKRISDFVYITFHHLPEHDSLPKTSPYSTFQKMNWPSDYHEYISKGWHIVYQKLEQQSWSFDSV